MIGANAIAHIVEDYVETRTCQLSLGVYTQLVRIARKNLKKKMLTPKKSPLE
jgi:hypothetical protein